MAPHRQEMKPPGLTNQNQPERDGSPRYGPVAAKDGEGYAGPIHAWMAADSPLACERGRVGPTAVMKPAARSPKGEGRGGSGGEIHDRGQGSCSDGSCGEVRRLIIDPATDKVTHLVIQPGHRREVGRLVPVHLVDTAAGEVRLRCTLAQFGQLDPPRNPT